MSWNVCIVGFFERWEGGDVGKLSWRNTLSTLALRLKDWGTSLLRRRREVILDRCASPEVFLSVWVEGRGGAGLEEHGKDASQRQAEHLLDSAP